MDLPELIRRYQQRLYRYLLRLSRDPSTAEDLFQQTWMRVAEKWDRYDAGRSFDTWLFSVAHNLAIDYLRRAQPGSLDEPKVVAQTAVAPDALERLLAFEQTARLEAALRELPASYRATILLRFVEGMKLEEIAEVTGAPLSTVKSRLRRGLEMLRSKLEVTQ
jgi:RNA polymerase sigma-70 factor, ECF subfamily